MMALRARGLDAHRADLGAACPVSARLALLDLNLGADGQRPSQRCSPDQGVAGSAVDGVGREWQRDEDWSIAAIATGSTGDGLNPRRHS
jgi:hypothetical protein